MFWRSKNSDPEDLPNDTLPRLRLEFAYYDLNSKKQIGWLRIAKVIQIVAGVTIPVVSLAPTSNSWPPKIIVACLGALISAIEATVQFGQFDRNWVRWRWAAEALRREAYLFSTKAGRYRPNLLGGVSADVLLAETVEEIISDEQQNWKSQQVKVQGQPQK